MVPWKSSAEEVSFEWSHQRILSTDLKVGNALHVFIIDSGSERGVIGDWNFFRKTSKPQAKKQKVAKKKGEGYDPYDFDSDDGEQESGGKSLLHTLQNKSVLR